MFVLHKLLPQIQNSLNFSNKIIGFFFNISDKYHPVARVYLAKLSDTIPNWKPICPLRALRLLWVHDLLKRNPFSKARLKKSDLIRAMKQIDGNNKKFKSHSLRIGAHTFLMTYGLPEAFIEFLARRKSPKIAQIYYRASAKLTLRKLRQFAGNFSGF